MAPQCNKIQEMQSCSSEFTICRSQTVIVFICNADIYCIYVEWQPYDRTFITIINTRPAYPFSHFALASSSIKKQKTVKFLQNAYGFVTLKNSTLHRTDNQLQQVLWFSLKTIPPPAATPANHTTSNRKECYLVDKAS